jgi:hypothetical protein
MINPYSNYILSFCLALGACWLGWSGLYPPVSGNLITFLALTFLAHLGLSFYWKSRFNRAVQPAETYFSPLTVTLFLYGLWILDFIYEGGIPLVKILFNQPYNYRQFGIPTLHVFIVTFGSFYTVYLFTVFIATRKRLYLYLYFINLMAALLIYSRAMLIFNVTSSVFVYLLSSPILSWKRTLVFVPGVMGMIYLFGLMGTLRVSFEAKKSYDPELFLQIGEATPAFRASSVPKEFFWGYIYLSSPVANLQHNINTFQVPPFSVSRMIQHVNNEMIFDFISKRANRLAGIEREVENTLPERPFNVSTVYSRSFSYQGWNGMVMMGIFILILPWIYRKLLPSNRYEITGLSILNTMYLFLFYDNTFRFTGLGFQLVYPFILPWAEKTHSWFVKKSIV